MMIRDYELIAGAFAAERGHLGKNAAYADRVALRLAERFAEGNPRFDRARFLAACGIDTVGVK